MTPVSYTHLDVYKRQAVFRERNGHIEQLSINEDYIKDGGKELQSIMKNGLFEEIKPDTTKEIEHIAPEDTSNKTCLLYTSRCV